VIALDVKWGPKSGLGGSMRICTTANGRGNKRTTSLYTAQILRNLFGPLALFGLAAASPALAADPSPPSTKLLEAQIISPGAAATFYGSSTQHSVGLTTLANQEPELDALARSLVAGRDVNNASQQAEVVQTIFDYVRNNINTEIRYGLGKGGRGAWIDQSGSPFDQAELMVKLLRKAGITAGYGTGEVQLSATQFGKWTGLVKQLNQTNQTFSVSAKQACRLLADGAIPAVINNQSSLTTCDSLSGDLSTVTIGHIWVTVGGTRYDPSLKEYYLKTGIDRSAAMGCGTQSSSTCGNNVKSAVTGAATTGTENGVPYIVGYFPSAGVTQVYNLALNLTNSIKATDRTMATVDVVGGKELNPQGVAPVVTYTNRLTWSGDVPDQYRTLYLTTSQIQNSPIYPQSHIFFADEIAGRRLSNAPAMLVDGVAPTYVAAPTRRTFPAAPCSVGCVTVAVDHPYADASGGYADEQQTFKLVDDPTYEAGFFRPFNSVSGVFGTSNPDAADKDFPEKSNFGSGPLVFIHGFGQASTDAIKYATEKFNVAPFYSGDDCVTGSTTGVVLTRCANESQAITAASINPYRTMMDRMVDGVAGIVTTRHHDIGVAYSGHTPEITRITLQESLSVAAKNDSDADRRAGYNLQTITLSEIEGMVSPLEDSAQFSFASMFFRNKALPNRATSDNISNRVYLVTPGNMAAFLATQPDAYPTPSVKGMYPTGWTCGNSCWRKTQLQAVADQGYSTIIMAGGQSELFFKGSASVQTEKAYTIWEYMKGGAAVSDPFKAAMKTTEVLDASSKARKQLSVSPATGLLTYQAEPDIVTGADDFPYSLPLVRTFSTTFHDRIQTLAIKTEPRNCGQGCGGLLTTYSHKPLAGGADGQFRERLGGGWDHNYNISATMTNNPVRNLGDDFALDAASTIARLQVIRDLAGSTDANTDLATHVSMFAATLYMGTSTDAVVKIGNSTDSFHMIPGGMYSSGNPNATLSITYLSSAAGVPIAAPVTYQSASGEVIQFGKSASSAEVNTAQNTVTLKDYSRMWLPTSWSFPNGIVLSFEYSLEAYNHDDTSLPCQFSWGWTCAPYTLPAGYRLTKVSNNLGRSLSFSISGGSYNYINTTVTDENGRQANFAVSGCAYLRTDSSANRWYHYGTTCDTFTATDPNGLTTTYKYSSAASLPGVRSNYRLEKIFTPTNATTPFQLIAYDEVGRVTKVTDRNLRETRYYPGGINGNELWKPSFVVMPGGERTFTAFNGKGSDIYSRSPLGRETRKSYDNANRPVKTILPEGNGSQTFYDARGNVVKARTFSKTCGAAAISCADDIVALTDYVGDETSMTCTNSVTCNKPFSETDPRGNVTNYSWNGTTGDLTQVLMPADKTGVRPQTDLGYTTLNGVSFLSSKTEKISNSQSVVTSYSYDSGNHYVFQSATVDPSGLNLPTILGYDLVGNLISVDGPLQGSGDTTTYKWDNGRRLEWTVMPDPDGASSLLRKMVKYTYNLDDQVIRTDLGTATASDGSGFVVDQSERVVYDSMGNKLEVRVVKP
jgi:YD repeat-containing protein